MTPADIGALSKAWNESKAATDAVLANFRGGCLERRNRRCDPKDVAQAQGTDSISELRKALGQFVPDALFGQHQRALGNGSLPGWSLSGLFFLKCSAQGVPVATPCVKHRLGGRWDAGGRSLRTPVPIVRREPA
jgi:hypothetical protein